MNVALREPTNLWCQALEERREALVANKVLHDCPARHLVLKVGILDARLDSIERCSDDDGSDGAHDRGDKVLGPGSPGVIRDTEEIFLCDSGTTKKLSSGSKWWAKCE